MKRSKKLIALLCVLAVVCVAAFAATSYEEKQEQIKTGGKTFLALDGEDVETVSWQYGEETLSFHRGEDGTWLWDEDDAFPVDDEKMASLLQWFQDLSAAFVIADVEDYGQYGLEDPECTITLGTEADTYTVTLGGYSQMDAQRYVSIGDGNAYLVKDDPLDDFEISIRDLIQNDQTPDWEQVQAITLSGQENYSIVWEADSGKSYVPADVYFAGDKPLDTTRVNNYLKALEDLTLTNYVTYNATSEELTSFGMDEPELTVTAGYTYLDGSDEETGTFTLHLSRNPEALAEAQAAEAAQADGEEAETVEVPCYARVGDSPIVYEISESDYEALTKAAYNDLRHRELMPADFEIITQIDVTLDGNSYTLTTQPPETEEGEEAPGTDSEEAIWYYDGEEIDIDDIQSAVAGLYADEFTEENASGKEEIAVTFHLNNEQFPTVTIQLYRYDGSDCLAVVDGESVALIDRVYAVDLIEAVLAIVLS